MTSSQIYVTRASKILWKPQMYDQMRNFCQIRRKTSKNYHNQILMLLALLHQRNVLDQDQIMLKKLRKVQINTMNYIGHRLSLLSQWEDIYLFDGQPGVNFIVQSCDSLEFFELIVTDEIVDHIATYSNLYASKANPLVIKSLRKHTCYVSGRTLLLLKSDCILPHWFIVECCTSRKSICIIIKTTFLRSQCLDELYHKIKWYY